MAPYVYHLANQGSGTTNSPARAVAEDIMLRTEEDIVLAFVNGNIFTVDKETARAEAFLVTANGTFGHVGTTAEIAAFAKEKGIVIRDLHGSFVMPGIHDAHAHIMMSARALTSHIKLPMEGLTSANLVEELKRGHCLCKYANVSDDWIQATAFGIDDFHHSTLDEAFPDTPVVIRGGAAHSVYMNSEAMRRAGYDPHEPDAQGSCYILMGMEG